MFAVLLFTWFVIVPSPTRQVGSSTALWTPGAKLNINPDVGVPAPASPNLQMGAQGQINGGGGQFNFDPGVPGPGGTPAPGPAPAPPMVGVMRVWGAEDSGSSSQSSGARSGARSAAGAGGAAGYEEGDPKTELAQRLTPTAKRSSEAGVDADINLLLPEGTTFGCLPQSPIDTQLVGSVSCTVDESVWSANGSNILIDKGATVSGEIQRGLGLGQDRAFILWHRVRSGRVYATLDSPGVDQLGQMGLPGELNEHTWQKIKATLLLTAIEGLGQAGQSLAQGSGNNYVNFSNGNSLAQQALQHDINIPTTLWRGQAWPIRIRVEHDIQFRKAYNNVLTAGVR